MVLPSYLEEAKGWGIIVRLPSVNASRMEYAAEADDGGKRTLRVGLSATLQELPRLVARIRSLLVEVACRAPPGA